LAAAGRNRSTQLPRTASATAEWLVAVECLAMPLYSAIVGGRECDSS